MGSGISVCPECNGVTGAHAITCPTLVQSSPVIPGSTCSACGATGYHKAACPLALRSRPDATPSPTRPSAKGVIAKVLQVDRDLGHTAGPANLADQIMAELAREGWTIA